MRLSVEGYKSIVDKCSINLSGLAVIAGTNSSGKSGFMQPFLILKQTIENNTDGDSLIINGENTNLTESNQILSKSKKDNSFSVYVEYLEKTKKDEAKCESKVTFSYDEKEGFLASESSLIGNNKNITLTKKMSAKKLAEELKKYNLAEGEFLNSFFDSVKKTQKDFVTRIGTSKPFLTIEMVPSNKIDKKLNFFSIGFAPNKKIEEITEGIIHIPGIRSNPERQYRLESYTTKYQGRFDKYIASIIYNWCQKSDKKLDMLKDILKYLGLATYIEAKKINEAHISLDISRTMNSDPDDTVNMSDVGFGISQILPLLVALIEAKKDNIIYVEQPEIHLHPQAQYKLAKIVCDFIKEGKKVIIETHSSIFIRGLQIEVAEGNLSPELFSLNWFAQDDAGKTFISESTLDENGAFGDWPADFDDTYLQVEEKYLNAVEKNIFS